MFIFLLIFRFFRNAQIMLKVLHRLFKNHALCDRVQTQIKGILKET
jgi:hypothetical protein